METRREPRSILTAPGLPTKSIDAVWSSCGCHVALIINSDGTRELAHEDRCHIGTNGGTNNGTR